jgi:DnaD/phage-associated family protein
MPERTIDTGFWNDPFVQPKSFNAKGFYLYSWTNQHCNQAGFYEISMLSMTRETGLDENQIIEAIQELSPKVIWYPDHNLLWVRAFVKRQSRSPKFLIAAGKCLELVADPVLVADYLDYYKRRYNIEIPYRYPIDTLSIPPARETDQKDAGSGSVSLSLSNSKSKGERGYGGERDPKLASISKLYEQNVGILTPLVAERLVFIRKTFPDGWFNKALKEAIKHNARSLSYIEAILERWSREGFRVKKGDKKKPPVKDITEGIRVHE